MNDEYDFGSNFDLGSFDDIGAVDLGNLSNVDFGSNFDLGSFEDLISSDLAGLEGLDLGGLEGLDLSGLEGMDLGNLDTLLGDGGESLDALLGGAGADTGLEIDPRRVAVPNLDFGSNFDLGSFEDLAAADLMAEGVGDFDQTAPSSPTPLGVVGSEAGNLDGIDFDSLHTEGMTPEQLLYRQEMLDLGGQDFGSSVDMGKSMSDFDTNLTDIMQNRGGFTSQWQDVDGRKVEIRDDGTGIAVNPSTGASRALSSAEVTSLINAGKLNSAGSGYNAATGGNNTAPGGGTSVTLKDGTKGTLLSSGSVIDSTGTVIGKTTDVKTVTPPGGTRTTTPPGGGGGGTTTKTPAGMGALLPLLLALLAMNKGGGGGGGSKGAVIPGLTATQRQTPYGQQQRAPGYRPGQGGVNYFEQTQFTPKMAAGGGIGGLLNGPGDGVSDSIPAVIDGNMAGGGQPAQVARGEYIMDARTVAALGNGSTDAGAERLDKMRENILRDDKKTGVGEDSKAYRHLMA
jgi:hypothetical protein